MLPKRGSSRNTIAPCIERPNSRPSSGGSRGSASLDPVRRATSCAFRMQVTRTQRRSDGTLTVSGVRCELPSAYRTLTRLAVRVARWDLSSLDLVDPRRGRLLAALCPLDKEANADRRRRALASPAPLAPSPQPSGVAPLLCIR